MNNYDILKEYEAHKAPVPSYEEWQSMDRLEKIMLQERARLNKQVIELLEENTKLKEYERIVTSYNMKPIDYEMACETVTKLLDEKKGLRQENTKLKELLKECKHIMSIEKDFASCHFEKDKLCKLLAKINQALGEDK